MTDDIASATKRKAEDDPEMEQPEATRAKLEIAETEEETALVVTDEQTSTSKEANDVAETTTHEDASEKKELEEDETVSPKVEDDDGKTETASGGEEESKAAAATAEDTSKNDDTNNNKETPEKSEAAKTEEQTAETNGNIDPKPADAAPKPSSKSNDNDDNDEASYIEETEKLQRQFVGRVIGRGGEMIRDLQARAGCRIDLDQRNIPKDQPVVINYRGTRVAIDFAKSLISLLSKDGTGELDLPLGSASRKEIIVPSNVIGKVIGRGGEMIREIQNRSGSKVNVEHNNSSDLDGSQRRVLVTGTVESVQKAEGMIQFIMQNPMMDTMTALNMMGSGGGGSNAGGNGGMNQQQYYGAARGAYNDGGPSMAPPRGGGGGTEHEIFPTQRQFIGRIVGKKGATIKDLQSRSGCEIQINQEESLGEQCHVTIKGPRGGIEMTKGMITEIIEMGPNHPYAGGGSRVAAPNMPYSSTGGGGGGYGGYNNGHGGAPMYPPQHQHQPHYGMGMPQQQPPYYGGGYGGGGGGYGGGGAPPPTTTMQPNMPPQYAMAPPPQQQYHHQQQQQKYGGGGGGGYGGMPPPPPPSPWKSAKASDGKVYYYNEASGETQWDKPAGFVE